MNSSSFDSSDLEHSLESNDKHNKEIEDILQKNLKRQLFRKNNIRVKIREQSSQESSQNNRGSSFFWSESMNDVTDSYEMKQFDKRQKTQYFLEKQRRKKKKKRGGQKLHHQGIIQEGNIFVNIDQLSSEDEETFSKESKKFNLKKPELEAVSEKSKNEGEKEQKKNTKQQDGIILKTHLSDHIGIFKRLDIDQNLYLQLPPEHQLITLKKEILQNVIPGQLSNFIQSQNHLIRKIVNIQNDMDSLGVTDYKEGYYASDPQLSHNLKIHLVKKDDLQNKGLENKIERLRVIQFKKELELKKDQVYFIAYLVETWTKKFEDNLELKNKGPLPLIVKLEQYFLKFLLLKFQNYNIDDVDANTKKSKLTQKGGSEEDMQQIIRQRALQFGVQKLKEMKHKMEEERQREESILNERLKNDVQRIQKKQNHSKKSLQNENKNNLDTEIQPQRSDSPIINQKNKRPPLAPSRIQDANRTRNHLNLHSLTSVTKSKSNIPMMIKEEPIQENEYTPIGSLVEEDKYIDDDDPDIVNHNLNIKKQIYNIPPRDHNENKHKFFTRQQVKLINTRENQSEIKNNIVKDLKQKPMQEMQKIIPKEMPHQWVRADIFSENYILMKPNIDASNKQIFAKNQYKTSNDAVLEMIEGAEGHEMVQKVFLPTKLGDYSNSVGNIIVNKSQFPSEQTRDLQLNYKLDPKMVVIKKMQQEEKKIQQEKEQQIVTKLPIIQEQLPVKTNRNIATVTKRSKNTMHNPDETRNFLTSHRTSNTDDTFNSSSVQDASQTRSYFDNIVTRIYDKNSTEDGNQQLKVHEMRQIKLTGKQKKFLELKILEQKFKETKIVSKLANQNIQTHLLFQDQLLAERTEKIKQQAGLIDEKIRRMNSIENFSLQNPDAVRKSHNDLGNYQRENYSNQHGINPVRNSMPSLPSMQERAQEQNREVLSTLKEYNAKVKAIEVAALKQKEQEMRNEEHQKHRMIDKTIFIHKKRKL